MKTIREIVTLLRSIDESLKIITSVQLKNSQTSPKRQIKEAFRYTERVRAAGRR